MVQCRNTAPSTPNSSGSLIPGSIANIFAPHTFILEKNASLNLRAKKLFLKSPFGLKRLLKLVIKFLLIVQIGKHSYDRELRRQRCKNLQRHE
jgi:hypothetical protein